MSERADVILREAELHRARCADLEAENNRLRSVLTETVEKSLRLQRRLRQIRRQPQVISHIEI